MLFLDLETTGLDPKKDQLHGIAVTGLGADLYFAYDKLHNKDLIKVLADKSIPKCGHNILGFDLPFLRAKGFEVNGKMHDTLHMSYLLDENGEHGLKELTEKYFGREFLSNKAELDRVLSETGSAHVGHLALKDLVSFQTQTTTPYLELISRYAVEDVKNTALLFAELKKRLEELDGKVKRIFAPAQKSPLNLYLEETVAFEQAKIRMQERGVLIDPSRIAAARIELTAEAAAVEQQLLEITCHEQEEIAAELSLKTLQKKIETLKTDAGKERLKAEPNRWTMVFSWSKPIHVLRLFDKLRIPEDYYFRTKKEGKSLDKEGIDILLERLNADSYAYRVVALYAKLKKIKTILNNYVGTEEKGGGILEHVDENMTVHPTFGSFQVTGRLNCIEENQLVQVPGGEMPIKDVKAGQYVYSYTNDNKLTLKKVLRVIDNGYRDCIEVKWQSSGDGSTGSLICTPEHRIKHKYRGWLEAKDLLRYDKLLHVRRETLLNGRIRLYSTDRGQELEEHVIKREFFNAPSEMHIHHIDENTANNNLNNLAVATDAGHMRIHSVYDGEVLGVPRKERKLYSKFALLKLLAKAKGRTSLVEMDFNTFRKHCAVHAIVIKECTTRYSESRIYLSKGAVLKAMNGQKVEFAAKQLGIGTRKLKLLCTRYKITYNHAVTSIREVGIRRVYDLEVEDTHNFIASEICVHNCSKPNLQQLPRQSSVKSFFIPRPGNVFLHFDASQVELRIAAHLSQDETLLEAYQEGQDLHILTAEAFFGGKVTKEDEERQVGKESNFLIIFDGKAKRLQKTLKLKMGKDFSEDECKSFIEAFFNRYPGYKAYLQSQLERMKRTGVVLTETGRIRRLPDIKLGQYIDWKSRTLKQPPAEVISDLVAYLHRKKQPITPANIFEACCMRFSHAKKQGYNFPIQGLGASIIKRAIVALDSAGYQVVNTVHDSIDIEVPQAYAEEELKKCKAILESCYSLRVPLTFDGKILMSFNEKDIML